MKKYWMLCIIIVILGFTTPFSHTDPYTPGYVKADLQESTFTDASPSPDDHKVKKSVTCVTVTISFLGILIFHPFRRMIQFDRRILFMNPIFYQSNYVIQPLMFRIY